MPVNERVCATCGKPTKLMLAPGGKGPRAYRCIDCDFPDPMDRPDLKRLLRGQLSSPRELKQR